MIHRGLKQSCWIVKNTDYGGILTYSEVFHVDEPEYDIDRFESSS